MAWGLGRIALVLAHRDRVLGLRSASCCLSGAPRAWGGAAPLLGFHPHPRAPGSGCRSLGRPPDPVSVRSENRDKTK